MGLFAASDRAAGGVARAATTPGQMALVALGVHLCADHLDDDVVGGLTLVQDWMDAWLAGPADQAARLFGMPEEALYLWQAVSVAALAAWTALVLELTTDLLLWNAFVLTSRKPVLTWSFYRRALSVHAVVMPFALAGALVAGSWSLAMAAEDLLPPSPLVPWAVGALALAVLARFGWAAWHRAVGALEPPARVTEGVSSALLLLPMGFLAWMHGAPIWGWLP